MDPLAAAVVGLKGALHGGVTPEKNRHQSIAARLARVNLCRTFCEPFPNFPHLWVRVWTEAVRTGRKTTPIGLFGS